MFEPADIRRLLDAFERSDWDEIHLVAEGVELHIASGPLSATVSPALSGGSPSAPVAPEGVAGTAPTGVPSADRASPVTPVAGVAAPPPQASGPAQMEGGHAVVAPSPGIFWRSPAPGEPPFVEVGQRVSPATPVGIVEVMKLMNQVLAGAEGTVEAILVENGAHVERGEPMVLIQPDA